MRIDEIEPKIGPFDGTRFAFMPGVNFLRGANGIGKTLILEYASLLGHVAAIPVETTTGTNFISMRVALTEPDRAFLDALEVSQVPSSPPAVRPIQFFERSLASSGLTLAGIVAAWVRYKNKRAGASSSIHLKFWFRGDSSNRLKEMLGDEALLKQHARVAGNVDEIDLVKALNLWSRPVAVTPSTRHRKESPPGFLAAPRLVNLLESIPPCDAVPGVVFYVNTDMYDFGIGLDVRESPKDLKKNLSEIMIERLQIVTCDVSNLGYDRRVSAAIAEGDEQRLICDKELRDDKSVTPNIRGAWSRVFTDKDHNFKTGKVTRLGRVAAAKPIDEHFEWSFDVGRREGFHEFVSSGENQALFVLSMLHGLASPGSCMIFDEPELHLTFGAGSLLIEEICKRAKDTKSQAIIVTHMPHLYRQHVPEVRDSSSDDPDEHDYETYRMIYLDHKNSNFTVHDDLDAVNLAAQASHKDIMELIDGMKLDEVRIRPSWASWPSAEKRFSELWRAILASDG